MNKNKVLRSQKEWDSQGPECVCGWPIFFRENCVIKHISSFHQEYKTFPSPIVSAWLDYELPVLSATSWVLHWAEGSIKTWVEEQSSTRAARGTFFYTGEHLMWVNYWTCIAWPGSWAHVNAWGRRVPLRQTGGQAYLGCRGLRKSLGVQGSAVPKTSGTHWSGPTDSQRSKTKMVRAQKRGTFLQRPPVAV